MKGYSLLLPLVFAMNMVQAQTPPDVEKRPHTVKSPHGESRVQCLRRLASPVFTPFGAAPVFTSLGSFFNGATEIPSADIILELY